jgi:uncharacterized membrane protein
VEILFILIALVLAIVALILAIVALAKPSPSGAEIWKIKHRIQLFQEQIDELKDRFSSSRPLDQAEQKTADEREATQPGQAGLFVPESKTASPLQNEKPEEKPTDPPPIPEDSEPKELEQFPDQGQTAEPDSKPSEPTEPEPIEPEQVAAVERAETPMPTGMDTKSIEMKLGTYWFVRIGVMLILTGLGILAYYKKQFFIDLSPAVKLSIFYLMSAAMAGVGFRLQRTKVALINYGQVLVAGGFAGVYFTTYAAHVFEPVQVIENPKVALLLLFSWGGFMAWFADRIKSGTIAFFAISASYYATYVPLIHTGAVLSQWVILFSNLTLAVASVFFLLRNRWQKIPVLSMAASYAGFLLWSVRVEEASLLIATFFAAGLWVVYTAAVFLSRDESFGDRRRAAFLTFNNLVTFALLTNELMKKGEVEFWVLPMTFGILLLCCVVAAQRFIPSHDLSRKSYLSQGLVLVTLGLMTMQMSDSIRGPILAAESVMLLFMAIRHGNFIIQISSFCVAAIAAVYACISFVLGSPDYLLGGLFTGVMLLFNAWLCHLRLESSSKSMMRLRVSCLTGVGIFVGMSAFLGHSIQVASLWAWVPAILLATTLLFTGSVYRLKIREFLLLGQVPGVWVLLHSIDLAESINEFAWQFCCASAITLVLAHWWRLQRNRFFECCPYRPLVIRLAVTIEAIFSAGFVFQVTAVFHSRPGEEWLWLGPLLTVAMTLYSVFTRARLIGLFSQVCLLISCLMVLVKGSDEYASLALIPILTMYLMNLGIPIFIERLGQMTDRMNAMLRRVQLAYCIIATPLGLLWIHRFVESEWKVVVFILVSMAFFAVHQVRPSRKWVWTALAYALFGYCSLIIQLVGGEAYWKSLLAPVALFAAQQLARRRGNELKVSDWIHKCLILFGGAFLFIWLSIKVSDVGGHGLRSIAWTILGVCYLGSGLGLKERWYRLMGLGTLAIALFSLVPIIWQMSTNMKIVSFFVMGLVFIGLGYVYTRFKEQIRKML